MNRREYAIKLGLAKPGRGRLSKAAHEAIDKALSEGVDFESHEEQREDVWSPATITPYVQVRNRARSEQLTGFTEEGWSVGFVHCSRCKKYMNYCACPQGIKPPSIVVTLDSATRKAVQYNHG